MSKEEKSEFRDSIRKKYNLNDTDLYVTGKNHFYKFEGLSVISKGIMVFDSLDVDPWYAQSILLIESPGQLKISFWSLWSFSAHAESRAQGLIVNKRSMKKRF